MENPRKSQEILENLKKTMEKSMEKIILGNPIKFKKLFYHCGKFGTRFALGILWPISYTQGLLAYTPSSFFLTVRFSKIVKKRWLLKKRWKNTTFSKIVKKKGTAEIVNKKHKNYTQKRYYNFKKGHFLGPFLI